MTPTAEPAHSAAPKRGGSRSRRLLSAALLAAAGLAVAGCGAVGHLGPHAGNPLLGKQVFENSCAACHTLAAAGTSGVVGPNLDFAFGPDRCQGFSVSTIQDVVRGQIAYADTTPGADWPPGSSNVVPGMPANIVTGVKARNVAAYVASVAGLTSGPGKHWDCSTGAYAS